jgi:hypothetical protein
MKRLQYFSSFNEDHIQDYQPRTTERPDSRNHVFRLKTKDGYFRLEILPDKNRFKLWVPFVDDALTGKRRDLETREEFYQGLGQGEVLPWMQNAFERLTHLKEQSTEYEELSIDGYTYLIGFPANGTIKVVFPTKTIDCDPEEIYSAIPEVMVLPELHAKLRDALMAYGLILPEKPTCEIQKIWDKNCDEK